MIGKRQGKRVHMNFLFHIVLQREGKYVYYNIYKNNDESYYAELLDNPSGVISATDFDLCKIRKHWKASNPEFNYQVGLILEEIERALNRVLRD